MTTISPSSSSYQSGVADMAKARSFGTTWWGRAWLEALEQRALVDPNRLPRGRTYARQGRVTSLEVGPGELRAQVWGKPTDPYSTTLSMRTLDADEWNRLDLFDEDPFALLTLRGRGREQVLTEVRARRSAVLGTTVTPPSDQPRGADPSISASQAYRREPVQLDRSPRVPPGTDSGLHLSVGADVVRRAARADADVQAVAQATGVDTTELAAAVAAWRIGGQAGYLAHRSPVEIEDAQWQRVAAALGPDAKRRATAINVGPKQLRVDRDKRWWRFEADDNLGWLLVDGPADDPADLL